MFFISFEKNTDSVEMKCLYKILEKLKACFIIRGPITFFMIVNVTWGIVFVV